jgi:hypothetical protein
MKKIAFLAALAIGASSLGGCSSFTSALSSFDSAITSPQNQAAIAVLEQGAVVFVCDISALATVAQNVETAAEADKSVTGTTGKVLAASSAACTGLGGLLAGQMSAPAGMQVIQ